MIWFVERKEISQLPEQLAFKSLGTKVLVCYDQIEEWMVIVWLIVEENLNSFFLF